MKNNITLKLDASLLREAKVMAAQEDTSISALVSRELESLVRRRKSYESARRRALIRLKEAPELGWARPKSRDELHER